MERNQFSREYGNTSKTENQNQTHVFIIGTLQYVVPILICNMRIFVCIHCRLFVTCASVSTKPRWGERHEKLFGTWFRGKRPFISAPHLSSKAILIFQMIIANIHHNVRWAFAASQHSLVLVEHTSGHLVESKQRCQVFHIYRQIYSFVLVS